MKGYNQQERGHVTVAELALQRANLLACFLLPAEQKQNYLNTTLTVGLTVFLETLQWAQFSKN